jgi:hypothetical protein
MLVKYRCLIIAGVFCFAGTSRPLSVDQKMAVSTTGPCTVATTKQQHVLDAEPKTAVSAKSYGR